MTQQPGKFATQDWELVYNGPGEGFSLQGNGRVLARNIVREDLAYIFLTAPELLKALKNLVVLFEGCLSRNGSPELTAFKNAHTAITKAETLYPRG